MARKIYVGNLPFAISETEVSDLFGRYGEVHSIRLITDRETGRPRGFGFVEMENNEANAAIEALNGTDFGGRSLRVNEAKDQGERPRRQW